MRVVVVSKKTSIEFTNQVMKELQTLGIEAQWVGKSQQLDVSCFQTCDAVIAIGGDGTIIHTAKHAAEFAKPVLGINDGHVGFTAGLESNELSLLGALKTGQYQTERRMLLSVKVSDGQGGQSVYYALNEAVITRGELARTIHINVECDGSRPIEYLADGIIIATPTGSTAYSLSAGGPVLDPKIDGIITTPLSPHSLNSRSIVFSPETVLRISASCRMGGHVYTCVDGEDPIPLNAGAAEISRAGDRSVNLIRIKNEPFYEVFRNKIIDRTFQRND